MTFVRMFAMNFLRFHHAFFGFLVGMFSFLYLCDSTVWNIFE